MRAGFPELEVSLTLNVHAKYVTAFNRFLRKSFNNDKDNLDINPALVDTETFL